MDGAALAVVTGGGDEADVIDDADDADELDDVDELDGV